MVNVVLLSCYLPSARCGTSLCSPTLFILPLPKDANTLMLLEGRLSCKSTAISLYRVSTPMDQTSNNTRGVMAISPACFWAVGTLHSETPKAIWPESAFPLSFHAPHLLPALCSILSSLSFSFTCPERLWLSVPVPRLSSPPKRLRSTGHPVPSLGLCCLHWVIGLAHLGLSMDDLGGYPQ
jgi:hypothetical protein